MRTRGCAGARHRDGASSTGSGACRDAGRLRFLRARLFSPLRYRDRKTIVSERIETGDLEIHETTVARSRQLRRRLGRDQDWKRQFLVGVQRNVSPRNVRPQGKPAGEVAWAASLLSAVRDDEAPGALVRRYASLLAHGLERHPVLDELAATRSEETTRFVVTGLGETARPSAA